MRSRNSSQARGDGRGLGRVAAEVVGGPRGQGVGLDHQPQEDLEVLDELGVARVGLRRLGSSPVSRRPWTSSRSSGRRWASTASLSSVLAGTGKLLLRSWSLNSLNRR